MAITQAVANSFKKELLEGEHKFQFSGGDVFKLALYVSTATLNSATTAYTHPLVKLLIQVVNILQVVEN
jgi:hypothetical protein